jgi:hypothetical protein
LQMTGCLVYEKIWIKISCSCSQNNVARAGQPNMCARGHAIHDDYKTKHRNVVCYFRWHSDYPALAVGAERNCGPVFLNKNGSRDFQAAPRKRLAYLGPVAASVIRLAPEATCLVPWRQVPNGLGEILESLSVATNGPC